MPTYEATIPRLGIYHREMDEHVTRPLEARTGMLVADLLVTAKHWKQPNVYQQ